VDPAATVETLVERLLDQGCQARDEGELAWPALDTAGVAARPSAGESDLRS
jgi:hypothetical protein